MQNFPLLNPQSLSGPILPQDAYELRSVWLVQMERGNEHDADVAAEAQSAYLMVLCHLERYVDFAIDRTAFVDDDDYREDVRTRAATAGVFYTIERREL